MPQSCEGATGGRPAAGRGLQQQARAQHLERGLAAQVGHVRLRERVGRAAAAELRERAREHAAVAAVHLLRDVLQRTRSLTSLAHGDASLLRYAVSNVAFSL